MPSAAADQIVILITGANTGIGLATATRLAKEQPNSHVIIGSRDAKAGEEAAAPLKASGLSVSSVQLDITSDESIAAAVKHIEESFGRLDVLVNNAGILIDRVEGLSTKELYKKTFDTNVLGTVFITEACLPLLRKSSLPRIIFLSSRMGSIETSKDKTTPFYSTDYKAYDASKAAVNMLAVNYSRILEPDGGLVNAVCPQLVKTKLTGWTDYGITPEIGAQRVVEVVVAGKDGPNATFSDMNGPIPW